MSRRPRSLQTLLWITTLTILFGWRVSDAQAQQIRSYLVVAVDVDGRTNYVQFSACHVPCQRVMQMDDPAAGQTMIIRLGFTETMYTAVQTGQFVMVDHKEKRAQVLNFSQPALADFILSAHSPLAYQTITIEEEPNPLYPACQVAASGMEWFKQQLDPAATPTSEGEEGGAWCKPTITVPKLVYKSGFSLQRTGAAPKTVTLKDFVLDREFEVEAEQYAFEFNYEMDMLPWLSRMAGDQQAAAVSGASPQGGPVPDLKLVMRSEGTTWVAPEAPGAADVYGFYGFMALAMWLQTQVLEPQGMTNPGTGNMTARMMTAMAAIAGKGMPVETTTNVTIAPSTGSMGLGAPAVLDFLPKNAFPSSSSTSIVAGIGRTHVDFDQEVPDWMELSYEPGLWDSPGMNEQGYEVFHSPPLGEGTAPGQ